MPRKNIPSYRLHKPTGQAIVCLRGKIFYLGKWKSKVSRERYGSLIAEYLANDCKLLPTRSGSDLTINSAVVQFLDYAEVAYNKNGKVTSTFINYRESLIPVVRHYGKSTVSEFGVLSLQFIRDKLIDAGYRPLAFWQVSVLHYWSE